MADCTIYIRVSDEVHEELSEMAAEQDRPISYIAARMIESMLAKPKSTPKKGKI